MKNQKKMQQNDMLIMLITYSSKLTVKVIRKNELIHMQTLNGLLSLSLLIYFHYILK